MQDVPQGGDQRVDHERLGQEGVHAAVERPLPLLLEYVGRHGHDRDGGARRVVQRTDALGGGVAVHDRHLNIHQHQIIAVCGRTAHLVHRDRAVFGGIDQKTVLMQDLHRDLAVELVVLDQQHVPSAEVRLRFGQDVRLSRRRRMAGGGQQSVAQVGQEHRLGAEGRHARRLRLRLDIRPVVGGQDDDGRVVVQAADLARDLDAVHVRQPPVDDIGAAGVAQLDGLARAQHGLPAGERPLGAHPHAGQQLGHAVAGIEIVVDCEYLPSLRGNRPNQGS